MPLGFGPVEVEPCRDGTQQGVTLGQQRIDRECLARLLAHERQRVTWWHHAVAAELPEQVSELRVRHRKLWIEFDRPFEVFLRARHRLWRTPLGVVESLQKVFVRLKIGRMASNRRRCRRQRHSQRARDGRGDLVLKRKHIGQLPIVPLPTTDGSRRLRR